MKKMGQPLDVEGNSRRQSRRRVEDKKFTPEQQGLINTVELAIDWNMDVAPEDVEEYHRLVDGKGGMRMARKRQLTEFGVRVKSELDRKGWTQRELADKCGINYRVVHDVLVGLNRKPENVRRIKEVLEFVDIVV